jgi:hypothetical protein
MIGLMGCKTEDKFSGKYGSSDVALTIEKNENVKDEYKFTFSGSPMFGEFDVLVNVKTDGTAHYVMKDHYIIDSGKETKNKCELDIKFFNDTVTIKEEPCGIYTVDGVYKKENVQSSNAQTANTVKPVAKTEAPKSTEVEQKIIFQTNSIQYDKSVYNPAVECNRECNKVSEKVVDYTSQGWKVVSSVPRTQAVATWCKCDGVEYIVSK